MPPKLIGQKLNIDVEIYRQDVLDGITEVFEAHSDTLIEKFVSNASFFQTYVKMFELDEPEKEELSDNVLQIVRKIA